MLYLWSHQGWIATNPFLENDTIISVENPCPAGWRMPTVEDTAVTIFAEDLPYKWGDTTFQVGTKSGTYRFQQSNCAYHRTVNLHLTVKSCPGVLINNVCWAKSNVDEPGTFAATPESYGMLYQWNRKKGWPVTGNVSGWDNSSEPGDIWEAVNDPCPAGWRIPTVEEMETLLSSKEVTSISTSQNEVAGRTFTDNVTGNSIFLPESYIRGGFDGESSLLKGCGNYWSSSPCELYFYESKALIHNPFKYFGLSVRCVVGPIITDTSVIVCAKDLPYTWCDTIFDIGTKSGTYSFQYVSAVTGNDSIVNLHLTVQQPYKTFLYDTLCQGDSYDKHGFSLSDVQEDDVYTLPLLSQAGCDSTILLHLKVWQIRDTTVYDTICEGDGYRGYGFDVTEAGTHVRRLQSVHGCDSVVTLTLTEEKKIQGSVGFLLDDCSTHGYSFFLDRQQQMMIDTWQWDMGDGTVYRSEEGFHQYADSGVYRIRLLAETHSGCENRFSHVQHVPFYLPEVSVHADRRVIDEDSCVTENGMRIEVVFLPKTVNTFTPNGDGVNDIFMAGFRIEVTDRNGRRTPISSGCITAPPTGKE